MITVLCYRVSRLFRENHGDEMGIRTIRNANVFIAETRRGEQSRETCPKQRELVVSYKLQYYYYYYFYGAHLWGHMGLREDGREGEATSQSDLSSAYSGESINTD